MAEEGVLEGGSIAKNRPRRNINLMQFTDAEYADESDVPVEEEVFQRPKTPPPKKATRKTNKHELDIEREKLVIEREKLEIEKEKLEIERERIRLQGLNCLNTDKYQSLPFKVKLQPFDPKLDDILTFLSEFDAVSGQANWSNDIRILQLRTLLTGEARQVSSQASTSYDDLKRALIDRYGKRPHEYFVDLVNVRKADNETYRALMARIIQNLNRCTKDKDPIKSLQEEFFLKALSPVQAQWVRRNKGSASVVEAAEDYIVPTKNDNVQNDENRTDNNRCFKCKAIGHYARDCEKKDKTTGNLASYLVKPLVGHRLICVSGEVNGKQVSFVKDTGTDMTLIREDLVDRKNILQGQNVTLQSAIGQPFCAKLAVVNIDTPYYTGIAKVGLVPKLAAEALLGMDILERTSNTFVLTREQAKRAEDQIESDNDTHESKVENAMEITKIYEDDEIVIGNISSGNIECTTSTYRPQSKGRCERLNGSLKFMLKKLCTVDEWDELVPYALSEYHEVPHEETGFSAPFELLYGWPVRGPMAIIRGLSTGEDEKHRSVIEHGITIRNCLAAMPEIVKEKIKAWYDKHTMFREFEPGGEVLLFLPSEASKNNADALSGI